MVGICPGGIWHGGYCPAGICPGVYVRGVFVRGVFVLEPAGHIAEMHRISRARYHRSIRHIKKNKKIIQS